MSFLDTVKQKIGDSVYSRLVKEAEREVGLAMQMKLLDQHGQKQYYRKRQLLIELCPELQLFEEKGLTILPVDIVNYVFQCLVMAACKSEEEFYQRCGGGLRSIGFWQFKSKPLDEVVTGYLESLGNSLKRRTLLAQVSSYYDSARTKNPQAFFGDLFEKADLPFVAFLQTGSDLVKQHELWEPGLSKYDEENARRFLSAPSIGFTRYGSELYCYLYASTWLRTFFNILRVAGFIHPGQMDFVPGVQFLPPKTPVFMGEGEQGFYNWGQDALELWQKSPDGNLFLSFGYRGLSQMYLDQRTFPGIKDIFVQSKIIFKHLENPWNERSLRDIQPTLEILSSAAQAPDLGAKLLLLTCCLEHLFVPTQTVSNTKRYIVGGIHAIRPDLLPWFDRLYRFRCDYAHKGFVIRDDQLRVFIRESMKNVFSLLVTKLSIL